ncbi:uncharacterized protein LOC107983085 isoform X2 [Anolis carolinensis]|uniref:uncharacterized protein LOC107983085 isoform X2 n=1 Tax=Anolis carolinensis TaxID=28377 RepID=UPI002F2B6797
MKVCAAAGGVTVEGKEEDTSASSPSFSGRRRRGELEPTTGLVWAGLGLCSYRRPLPVAASSSSGHEGMIFISASVMTHGPCSPVPSAVVTDEEENLGFPPFQPELELSQPEMEPLHLQEICLPEVCQTSPEPKSPPFSHHDYCKQQRGAQEASRRSARIAAKHSAD